MKIPFLRGREKAPANGNPPTTRPRANGGFDVREKAGLLSIIVVVWLAINLVVALLVNAPRALMVTSRDEQSARLAAQVGQQNRDVSKLREEYARITSGNSGIQNFYDVVLSTKQQRLINFQKELRDIAKQFNINYDSVSYPREYFPKEKVAKFGAVMPMNGSYANLREFVERIEASQNFIVIEQIQLANSKEGGVILSLGINLATYFVDPEIPEPTTPGQAAAPGRKG